MKPQHHGKPQSKKAAKRGPSTWGSTPRARARIHRAVKKHARQVVERATRQELDE